MNQLMILLPREAHNQDIRIIFLIKGGEKITKGGNESIKIGLIIFKDNK